MMTFAAVVQALPQPTKRTGLQERSRGSRTALSTGRVARWLLLPLVLALLPNVNEGQPVSDNNYAPVFRYSDYSRTVGADAKSGSSLVDVLATDNDAGKNGEIRYVLEPYAAEIDATSYLVVDSVSGRVSLLSPASSILLVTDTLLVWVKAVDGGLPPREAKVTLHIQIKNY